MKKTFEKTENYCNYLPDGKCLVIMYIYNIKILFCFSLLFRCDDIMTLLEHADNITRSEAQFLGNFPLRKNQFQ